MAESNRLWNATAVPAHHNPHCTQEPVNSQTLRLYRPTTIRTARRNLSTAKRYGCTGPPQSVLLAGTCQQPNDFSPSGAEIKLAYVWAVGAGYSLCWLDRISFNFRQWAPNGTSEQFVELYNSYRWVDCVCVCVCVCVCGRRLALGHDLEVTHTQAHRYTGTQAHRPAHYHQHNKLHCYNALHNIHTYVLLHVSTTACSSSGWQNT